MIQDVSMRTLASLTEAHDNVTGNHILRTQAYVKVLANELSRLPKYAKTLTPETIESYSNAALLHDIGKVGIPDHVLNKRGKLTHEEWEIMKTHAKIGADAIRRSIQYEEDQSSLGFMHVAMDIARHHHEKWDGSGYPDGLQGEAIPLSARLMALADVFDALITKRVYKPVFSMEEATKRILKGRGKHFDPELVDAFLAQLDDFRAIAVHHAGDGQVSMDGVDVTINPCVKSWVSG